ncbi:hypothetical protein POM88_021514 [Heracleum sosnowskyi]|uniref:SPARK domain-containing protein n=1 Tax=Heracleum sosnowskyi TaxID=360622 RepID=A0AAD8MSW8_9APIA|nr:hypothetical protein POM88_021514 [Heracleum sosnowskyi]
MLVIIPNKVEGDWGGFLNKNSCAGPFEEYLYALACHTSQTGDIFLNSDEKSDCLTTINGPGTDDVGCGIEKLTKGGGGCSDFSVKDVNNRLGDDFQSMKEKCELEDQGKNQNQSCGSCLRSWEGIKGTYFGNDEPTESESYMCKFAVLVSLISTKIDDEIWIHGSEPDSNERSFTRFWSTSSEREKEDQQT